MKKVDQRIKVTKILIGQALGSLAKEKSLSEITVKELCEKAQINRGTFYSHYKDINDLVTKIKIEFVNSFKDTLLPLFQNPTKDKLTSADLINSIISFFDANKDLCRIIIKDKDSEAYLSELLKIGNAVVNSVYPKAFVAKSAEDVNLYYLYVSGGSVYILIDWIKNDFKTPKDVLAQKINKLISCSLAFLD